MQPGNDRGEARQAGGGFSRLWLLSGPGTNSRLFAARTRLGVRRAIAIQGWDWGGSGQADDRGRQNYGLAGPSDPPPLWWSRN